MANSIELKEKINNLTTSPGVYIMRSASGQIIYIGKAKNLRNRVSQYFDNSRKNLKVSTMVSHIDDFEYIITNSELEALILENDLIKKHQPPYNILLKDGKTYPYIRIDLNEEYPCLRKSRGIKLDGAKYFGPYMQGININELIDFINDLFKLRHQTKSMQSLYKRTRPCLNYYLKNCYAPCKGLISKEEYSTLLSDAIAFLKGNYKKARVLLEAKMKDSASKEDFETALICKKHLDNIEKIKREQIVNLQVGLDYDVISMSFDDDNVSVAILFVRQGKINARDIIILDKDDSDISSIMSSFIIEFYSSDRSIPDSIIVNVDIDNIKEIEEYLKIKLNKKINIIFPKRGDKRMLMLMANKNADDLLKRESLRQKNIYQKTMGAMHELKEILNLDRLPLRIECYDISHISGTNKVASMTVMTNGKLNKKDYRRFKIKNVDGNNDFASINEVIDRRMKEYVNGNESFNILPDIMLIDGGFGQLHAAREAISHYGKFESMFLMSIAEREELLCLENRKDMLYIDKNSSALQALQLIRDEAHRFAVTYHSSLREKEQVKSLLHKKLEK